MTKTPRPHSESGNAETAQRLLAGGPALLADWNASLADFYARRAQKYWQYPFALAEMKSLADVAHSLAEFERELLADYADQADELRRIARSGGKAHHAPASYEAHILEAQNDAAQIIEEAKAQAEHIVAAARARMGEAEAGEEPAVAPAGRTARG